MKYALTLMAAVACGVFGAWLTMPQAAPAPNAHNKPGVVDIGFAQHMSQHHDQAIFLATLFLHGHESGLSGFAEAVRQNQLLELGQMRGWLSLWDQALAPSGRSMDWMLAGQSPPDAKLKAYLVACENSASGMPGLATGAQIEQLDRAHAEARDRLFLKLMMAHHEGGLPMLEFAAREARLTPVRQLAQRMLMAQTRETVQMQLALAQLSANP